MSLRPPPMTDDTSLIHHSSVGRCSVLHIFVRCTIADQHPDGKSNAPIDVSAGLRGREKPAHPADSPGDFEQGDLGTKLAGRDACGV